MFLLNQKMLKGRKKKNPPKNLSPRPNIYAVHSHPLPLARSYVKIDHSNTIIMDSVHSLFTVGLVYILNPENKVRTRHKPMSLRYDDYTDTHTIKSATTFSQSDNCFPRHSGNNSLIFLILGGLFSHLTNSPLAYCSDWLA